MHHPFTAPMDEDIPLLDTDPAKVRAKAYDIILNGCEAGRRLHSYPRSRAADQDVRALGFTEEKAKRQFGHLITAYSLRRTSARWSGFTVWIVCACCSPVWIPSAT